MKNLSIIKSARLEDLAMWSLCKNILDHFYEMEHYIKEKSETGEIDVDVSLALNLQLLRDEPEVFDKEDLDTFEKCLKDIYEEKISVLTIAP